MRTLCVALCALAMLSLTSCKKKTPEDTTDTKKVEAAKPADLIVGKWEPADEKDKDKGTMEFTKDGTMKMVMGGITAESKYKISDDGKTLEIEMDLGGKKEKKSGPVKVSKDELVLTEPDDPKKETKMKRAK